MKRIIAAAAASALIFGGGAAPARATADDWQVTQLLGGMSISDRRIVIDVAATSATDAWAVGGQSRGLRGVPYAQHWDGTQWQEVTLPGDLVGSLDAVTASSPNDVWAFGNENSPTYQQYLMHFDGTTWTKKTAPPYGGVTGVSLSARDLWVPTDGGNDREYVQHWNGKRWRAYRVRMHNLNAMAAISHDDVWLVGRYESDAAAMHWNGRRWSKVPLPAVPDDGVASLTGVVATASDDVWAVGSVYWQSSDQQRHNRTIVMHWDGRSWRLVDSPPGEHDVSSVASDGAGGIWIVQQSPYVQPQYGKAELLRYTDGAWRSYPVTGIPDERRLDEAQLANVPGSQSMWGAATFCFPYECDWRSGMIRFN